MFDACTLDALEPRALLAVSFDGTALTTALPSVGVGAAQSIVAADFDGDGQIDLAASFHDRASPQVTNHGIAFYRGHQDGTFDAAVWTSLPVRAGVLAAVRFVGLPVPAGGGLELVSVGGFEGTSAAGFGRELVRVFKLNIFTHHFEVEVRLKVDGLVQHFGDPTVTLRPGGPVIGDFTGDGKTDIAFAINAGGGRGIAIVEHGSVGALTLRSAIDTERVLPSQSLFGSAVEDQPLTVGDLDADGRKDLVFRTVNGFFALRNSASGITGAPVSLGFASNIDWRFADIDGDNRLDAVSTWIPVQAAGAATELHAFVRVKRGQGPGVGANAGTLFFGALERIGTVPIGPRDPTGGVATSAKDRLGFIIGPDLDANGRGDIFIYRDYAGHNLTTQFSYQRVETISAPPAPAAAPAWPESVASLAPDYQQSGIMGAPVLPLAHGIPFLFDVNDDASADLIQIVNGRLEVRLNVDA